MIDGFYRIISGTAGTMRDWDAFRTLFLPGAILVPCPRDHGPPDLGVRSVDAYIERLKSALADKSFFERGSDYRIERMGDIAHVTSRYEAFNSASGGTLLKCGTNLILLARSADEWKIASMVWQDDVPRAAGA